MESRILTEDKYGISGKDWNEIFDILNRFSEIEKVWLYGSRAMNEAKQYSDIDMALEGKDLTLTLRNDLVLALEDLALPYSFDVSIKGEIENANLLNHIERVGKLIYTSPNIKPTVGHL